MELVTSEIHDDLANIVSESPATAKERKKNTRMTDEIREQINSMLKKGHSFRDVSQTLNVSKSNVFIVSKQNKMKNQEDGQELNGEPQEAEFLKEKKEDTKQKQMDDIEFANAITAPVQQIQAQPKVANKIKMRDESEIIGDIMRSINTPSKPAMMKQKPQPLKKHLPPLANFENDVKFVLTEKVEDRAILITKIQMNVDNFADTVLKDHIKPDRDTFMNKVSQMSDSELSSTLKLLETVRTTGNLTNQMKYMLYGATNLIEIGSQKFLGLRSSGYAEMVRRQEAEINSCLKEIALNNIEAYKKVERPEMRLASVLVMTLLATDSHNRLEDVKANFRNKPIDPEANEEFKDL
jgi:uncharacterized protein YdbL (DUF1318 family)